MRRTMKIDMSRRSLLIASLLGASPLAALPKKSLSFPRDHGSHPEFRTEWWYVTGFGGTAQRELGFQLTFFRSRVEATQQMQSRLAARQLLFAHAAVTDVANRKVWHEQLSAREGMEIARAREGDIDLRLRDWSMRQVGGDYQISLQSREISFDLTLRPTQPLLLQGDAGLSRKGPATEQASYYYSHPQLALDGKLRLGKETIALSGKAWLDHEWSNQMLHPQARGWDWIGMNLDDGSAVTAFQIRDGAGRALWDGGSFRHPKAPLYNFSQGEVIFRPQRLWTSPISRASYPVEWIVRTPADFYTVKALLDNQELDSRASTGTVYWEGLSELFDSNGRKVGRGYLEMTGYASPIRLHG